MTTEQDQAGEAARRRFDDVTSLFGGIVPPAGTPVRPKPAPRTLPTTIPDHLADAAPEPKPVPLPGDTPAEPAAPRLEPPPAPPVALVPPASPPSPLQPPDVQPPIVQLPATPDQAAASSGPPPAPSELSRPAANPARARNNPFKRPAEPKPAATEAPAGARPRPTEIPWPDAFEPRPNFRRKHEEKTWSWFLLMPLGAVVAIAVTMIDPRGIRAFLDRNVLHREPPPAPVDTVLLPTPFRSGAVAPGAEGSAAPVTGPRAAAQDAAQDAAPAATPPSAPVPPSNATSSNSALPEPTVSSSAPDADTPASAAAVPPAAPAGSSEAAASAPPAALPTPSAAPPAAPAGTADTNAAAKSDPAAVPINPVKVVIQFRRNQPGAEGEARRVAALLGSEVSSVELHPSGAAMRSPVINYYSPADKDAATAIARSLANEGSGWIVRAGPKGGAPGSLDLWLP